MKVIAKELTLEGPEWYMLFVSNMYGFATFIFARANLGQPAYLLEQVGPIDSYLMPELLAI